MTPDELSVIVRAELQREAERQAKWGVITKLVGVALAVMLIWAL
jgi:hypothetical protein